MKQSSKYSLNGVYRCENFAQHVENNDFPELPIGSASGFNEWFIDFRVLIYNGGTWVYPFIFQNGHPKVQVRAYFNILKKDGSSSFETESKHVYLESDEGSQGNYMNVEVLLDERNGYLDGGALTVEYGFQIESIERHDGIWKFNVRNLFFDWQTQDNMFDFIFDDEISLFGHKQIIKLQSNKWCNTSKDCVRVPKSDFLYEMEICLPIIHGVRLELSDKGYERTIKFASCFGFSNAVRYCEQQLIELDEEPDSQTIRKLKFAVKFKLDRYSNYLIKHITSQKQLTKILKRFDIEKMSSESMKAFVAKILFL